MLWFEIVLDWEGFILLFVKRTVKNGYKIISALQRLSFVHIKLVQCKTLVSTTQALQCLVPNAVLAVHFHSAWGEATAQEIQCAVWELPCVGQKTWAWE